MKRPEMAVPSANKRTMRLLLAAIVLAFLSLAVPWWTFVLLYNWSLASSFNLFLFGVVKIGFQKANLLFEWWSYLTFAAILIGSCIGLVGYRLLALGNKKGTKLVVVDIACMITGCIFYAANLALTIASSFTNYQDFWLTIPIQDSGPIMISLSSILGVQTANAGFNKPVVAFRFLSIGFVLTVASFVLLIIACILGRAQLQVKDSSSHKSQSPDL